MNRDTGKYYVESKKDMKKRGVKSPDCADALALSEAAMSSSWTQLKQDLQRLSNDAQIVAKKLNDYHVALDMPAPYKSIYGDSSGW
jgi:hypothetical protein